MKFNFSKRAKTTTIVMMILGVIGILGGLMSHNPHDHGGQEFWSNLLVCGFFFFAIALGGLFFYALQYAAEVGWSSQLKRVFEGIYHKNIIVFSVVLLIVFIASTMHMNHIYHWMDASTYSEYVIPAAEEGGHAHYTNDAETPGAQANLGVDKIIKNKRTYLNETFWWIRTLVYLGVFVWFGNWFRKKSLEEDQLEGTTLHTKMFKRSAIFLVLFAVFSSTLSWDWLMSIDTHWFSTMYGWYVFSGMWVTFMIFATIVTLYLKEKGYLPKVNDSHIHDMGKWIFGISMLWSYLGLCQFLLIWYANIGEEVIYYQQRFEQYAVPLIIMCVINFALPFFMLIARDAKRNPVFLRLAGFTILVGHYVDVYLLVMPGTMYGHSHYSWWQPLMFIGFLGVFLYLMFNSFTKAPMVPVNHPFLDESEHHHI
ncbi:MAG: quinol:cytochrome C oxidoreductase [Flavobacteriales bacterium]